MTQVFQVNKEELKEVVRECVQEAMKGLTALPTPEKTRVKNVDEAAQLLGVSKATVHRLIKEARQRKGSFPFHKQGGTLMFLESELMEWVTSKR